METKELPVLCFCGHIAVKLLLPAYENISNQEFRCANCKGVMVVTTSHGVLYKTEYKGLMKFDELINIDVQTNVPEASACIQEATICVNNDAKRAAMVMARAALEVTLKYAGFTAQYLSDKVKGAIQANALTGNDKTRAKHVRLIGNFGAHGSSAAQYASGDEQTQLTDAEFAVKISSELVRKLVQWRMANP
jgi:hypothetical protein